MLALPQSANGGPHDPVCTVVEVGTCVQILVRGEVDITAGGELRATARDLPLSRGRVVVLDLCAATFLDTGIVHFANDLNHRVADHGAILVIVADARTKQLFERTGADGLTIVEDGHPGPRVP